jgi:hypothetical protein
MTESELKAIRKRDRDIDQSEYGRSLNEQTIHDLLAYVDELEDVNEDLTLDLVSLEGKLKVAEEKAWRYDDLSK